MPNQKSDDRSTQQGNMDNPGQQGQSGQGSQTGSRSGSDSSQNPHDVGTRLSAGVLADHQSMVSAGRIVLSPVPCGRGGDLPAGGDGERGESGGDQADGDRDERGGGASVRVHRISLAGADERSMKRKATAPK